MTNLINNPQNALTGPLVRNDQQTIARKFKASNSNDPYQAVYQAFVKAYQQEKS